MRHVVNLMEETVETTLYEVLKDRDVCKCEVCLCDMYALALNNLKPMYAVRSKGKALFNVNKTSQQGQADILSAIIYAIHVVSHNPKHEEKDIENSKSI